MAKEEFIRIATQLNGWNLDLVTKYFEEWEKKPALYKEYFPLEKNWYITDHKFYLRGNPCE